MENLPLTGYRASNKHNDNQDFSFNRQEEELEKPVLEE
jgi:hypothetical protein